MTPRSVTGFVTTADGAPLQGVMVMGLDLNYAETDADGRFELTRPEMAVFCWLTGFRPTTRLLTRDSAALNIVMEPVANSAARAAGAGR